MTAKEKAFELILKIETELIENRVYRGTIKKLALIQVDEILETLYSLKLGNALSEELDYWEQVKHEISNL